MPNTDATPHPMTFDMAEMPEQAEARKKRFEDERTAWVAYEKQVSLAVASRSKRDALWRKVEASERRFEEARRLLVDGRAALREAEQELQQQDGACRTAYAVLDQLMEIRNLHDLQG